MPFPCLTPHRHLQLIKWILHHVIGIQLVDPTHHCIHIRLLGFCEEQKFSAGDGLETREPEEGALENFEAGKGLARKAERGGHRGGG